MENVSKYPHEAEVLITPGNLFRVRRVAKNSDLNEIYLEHISTTVSTFKKLSHTIKSTQERPTLVIQS